MNRALLVDDKEENLYYLGALLKANGFEVESARHGVDALSKARAAPPDVVISDLLMPVMDGYSLLRQWRADPILAQIPFVVYTATYTEPEDEQLALSLGADAFVLKPSEPEELIAHVRGAQARGAKKVQAERNIEQIEQGVLLREYNETLVRKLEVKSLHLEESSRALQTEIHERRQLSETLASILDALPAHIALIDSEGVILAVNESWRRFASTTMLGGFDVEVGQNYLRLCEVTKGGYSEGGPQMAAGIWSVLERRCTEFSVEYPCHSPTKQRWFRMLVTPQTKESRGGAVVMHIDITATKELEERLKDQAALIDQARDAIMQSDLSYKVLFWNRGAERLYGWTSAEAVGRSLTELAYRSLAKPTEALQHTLEKGEWSGELEDVTKSGHAVVVESRWAAVRAPDGRATSVLMINSDITEHKRLEAQFLQSQKMEAIGRLAGGVAHDFNNLLGVILGYGELLIRGAEEPQRGKIAQIIKAGQRAAGLTRQLLAFSRKQVVELSVLDVNVLLLDLENMLGRLIGEDISLAILPGAVGQVKADSGQLEQVVMNLCVNARDAMPEGGMLSIETANVDLEAVLDARRDAMPPGRYLMLAVSDTGSGIEKDVLDKIFEPFFTTKEPGKGTGLGLSTVYGIVKQAGGFVWVYSELGRGTTFKIYLPRVDEQAAPIGAQEAAKPVNGSETILVVEDEPSLRMMTREILEDSGYRVLEAGGGAEALQVVGQHAEPVHLLLTDVVMPSLNGRALAESLMTARPGLKVLYMSGYTDDIIARRGVLEPGTAFIGKPFTALALLRRIRDVLDHRENA